MTLSVLLNVIPTGNNLTKNIVATPDGQRLVLGEIDLNCRKCLNNIHFADVGIVFLYNLNCTLASASSSVVSLTSTYVATSEYLLVSSSSEGKLLCFKCQQKVNGELSIIDK